MAQEARPAFKPAARLHREYLEVQRDLSDSILERDNPRRTAFQLFRLRSRLTISALPVGSRKKPGRHAANSGEYRRHILECRLGYVFEIR